MEVWITSVVFRKGKRVAKRMALNVPLDMATGNYQALSDRALNDIITDLTHEKLRRFSA
jgi:hypothetical protein